MLQKPTILISSLSPKVNTSNDNIASTTKNDRRVRFNFNAKKGNHAKSMSITRPVGLDDDLSKSKN